MARTLRRGRARRRPRPRALARRRGGRAPRRASRSSSRSTARSRAARSTTSCSCEGAPRLARLVLDRARAVICVSEALTEAARAAGVERAVFIPNGIDDARPRSARRRSRPRSSTRAGSRPRRASRTSPRSRTGSTSSSPGTGRSARSCPQALGFLAAEELERRYARAAIVVCPSRSEGFGIVCAEAMANGKPVVAGAVGGLVEPRRARADGAARAAARPGGAARRPRAPSRRPPLRLRLGAAGRGEDRRRLLLGQGRRRDRRPSTRRPFARLPATEAARVQAAAGRLRRRVHGRDGRRVRAEDAWTRLRLAAVEDLVEPRAGERVLDLGCAAGAITHFLSTFGCEPVGVDAEPVAIERARALFPDLRVRGRRRPRRCPSRTRRSTRRSRPTSSSTSTTRRSPGCSPSPAACSGRAGRSPIYTPNPRHLIERLKERELLLAQNPTHIGLRTAGELAGRDRERRPRRRPRRVAREPLPGPPHGRALARPRDRLLPLPALPARGRKRLTQAAPRAAPIPKHVRGEERRGRRPGLQRGEARGRDRARHPRLRRPDPRRRRLLARRDRRARGRGRPARRGDPPRAERRRRRRHRHRLQARPRPRGRRHLRHGRRQPDGPGDLATLVGGVASGECDYAKANRLFTGQAWQLIPRYRYLGNADPLLLHEDRLRLLARGRLAVRLHGDLARDAAPARPRPPLRALRLPQRPARPPERLEPPRARLPVAADLRRGGAERHPPAQGRARRSPGSCSRASSGG